MTTTGVVVSVTPTHRGDTLAAATTAGDTLLWVEDAGDFAEDDDFLTGDHWLVVGDSGPIQYVATDMDSDAVTLAAPVGGAYEAGLPVRLWDPTVPPTGAPVVEYVAYVELSDDSGTPDASVPHELVPLAGVDNLVGALVEIRETSPQRWEVAAVLGREPVIDGSKIDPDTMPPVELPPTSDGDAPTSSPTPAVTGGIGAIVVAFPAADNPDPTTVDVYVSTATPVPTGGTPVASVSTDGPGLLFIRRVDGAPVVAGTTYYVATVARDADGPGPVSVEGTGTPALINSPDIAANAVTADMLVANNALIDALEVVDLTATTLTGPTIQTAATGERAVIGTVADSTIEFYTGDPNELAPASIAADTYYGASEAGSLLLESGRSLTFVGQSALLLRTDRGSGSAAELWGATVLLAASDVPGNTSNGGQIRLADSNGVGGVGTDIDGGIGSIVLRANAGVAVVTDTLTLDGGTDLEVSGDVRVPTGSTQLDGALYVGVPNDGSLMGGEARIRRLAITERNPWQVVGTSGNPAFLNGWTHQNSVSDPVRFRLNSEGNLVLGGRPTGVSSTANNMFVLPEGFYPVDYNALGIGIYDKAMEAIAELRVGNATGGDGATSKTVTLMRGTSRTWYGLNGVTIPR